MSGFIMMDLIYAVIKAAARIGGLLSNQQIMELASSRDLKDLLNRAKERYPALALNVTPTLREIEDLLLKAFRDEMDEFINASPGISPILQLIKREVEEGEATDLMKQYLGILDSESRGETPKRPGKEEKALAQLYTRGFDQEVKEAKLLFEKYGVPGLVDSVFVKHRTLKMLNEAEKLGRGTSEGLKEYLKLQVDIFNFVTLLRGIKNGIDRRALEEVLIFSGGSLSKEDITDVLKATDAEKALAFLVKAGLPKVESMRGMERAYETKISKILTRTYYKGYVNMGAIVGYLELRLREIKNLIRIANSLSRGLDPKRIAQDFIF